MMDNTRFQELDLAALNLSHFLIYFAFAAIIALYLILKSNSGNKFELFFISFYLLTGNLNSVLTIEIPGLSLFEIQPIRFIFLLFCFLIIRKTLLSKRKFKASPERGIPWFMVALFAFIIWHTLAILVNISNIGIPEGIKTLLDAVVFLVIVSALRLIGDVHFYNVIGKSIIIGAVVSSLVSLIQFSIDPYFMRIGDMRQAFGTVLRSNGIFKTEYFNSYFLITAVTWCLITVKHNLLKMGLVSLFSLAVICSFQRMSWIILALVLLTYFIFIRKIAVDKIIFTGVSCMAVVLVVSVFYYQDIMNSSMVKERLADTVGGRQGYYGMVIDNIGDKPLFGYGNLKNEVYYSNLMRITGNRDRATATSGDLHSGYFSALFLYGIPAFVFFTLFVLLSVTYYSRLFNHNLYFAIPFLISILYLIGNLTNNFLFPKYISILFAIHIGIGMGINKLEVESAS